ncbi:hypothetical protein A2773_03350 [Candidatus Gottesmanbacteria bacterium RIFCSPHIGHO2_01_FULL_39_10]|uniref:Dockerin domain-containing protein n=1 Tax=Candidatus Gottesmanbacteria bacterium RIFCSPHIGHO2_01_FULL_39_10 TaxID=1798375 RepID=A0A1F5ZMD4_9BACT|nr:MAG: hypothetical protein A2773_03350 [Candidatus Gottesmanbacteria bacterium RIFCSPHIGHO2_01_FULL_39_10]
MTKRLTKIIYGLLVFMLACVMPLDLVRGADYSTDTFISSGAFNSIMPDNDFVAINSMTEQQIQDFLISYNSYLKDYTENGKSAARIIYEASHGLYDAAIGPYKGINITSETGTVSPKVILIFLQKEQSLLTTTTRNDYGLTYAMGYDCPDATGCSGSRHPGFAEQVGWGAWQLRGNFEGAKLGLDWWNQKYGAGSDTIFYVGQTKSIHSWNGDRDVTFQNAATASIYRYTPHIFDSSYNVWQFFNSWTWPSPPSGGNNPAPTPPAKPVKPGDVNNDDAIDILDLSILANAWDQAGVDNKSDFNGNGIVDIQDLSTLASNWGK